MFLFQLSTAFLFAVAGILGQEAAWTEKPNLLHGGLSLHNLAAILEEYSYLAPELLEEMRSLRWTDLLSEQTLLDPVLASILDSKADGDNFRHVLGATINNVTISDGCLLDLASLYQGVRQNSTFAFQVADAAAKPAANVMSGALTWPGSYGECMRINDQVSSKKLFDTHYCLTRMGPNIVPLPSGFTMISVGLHIGLCMPKACSSEDVNAALILGMQQLQQQLQQQLNISLTNNPLLGDPNTTCQPNADEVHYDTKAEIWIGICVGFAFVMACGTILDVTVCRHLPSTVIVRRKTSDADVLITEESEATHHVAPAFVAGEAHPIVQFLLAFSVYSNTEKIMATGNESGLRSFGCLHGIRFLSMAWVILGHTYVFGALVFANILDGLSVTRGFLEHTVSNALVSVDTFFVLSGFLVAYVTLSRLPTQSSPKFWILYYFHRFWRLTPPYMLVLGLYVSLFAYTGSGPWFPYGGPELNSCRDSWYSNFLYVNNLWKDQEMCMSWTWYLANDMQFYVISPIFLYLFYKKKLFGIAAVLTTLLAHIIVTGVITHHYNLPISQFASDINATQSSALSYSEHYYFKPWTRIGPYLIGLLLGFLIVSKPSLHIKKVYQAALWVISAGISFSIVYGTYPNENGHPFSNNTATTYNTLHRTAWACAVSWMIAACVYGYGGPINTFLSHKTFVPLSRLTYCTYLIHPIIMFYRYYTMTTPLVYEPSTMVYLFCGNLVVAFGLGFVVSLAFEAPMMQLEKIVLRRVVSK